MASSNQLEISELECCVCLCISSKEILQCINGHIFCSECRARFPKEKHWLPITGTTVDVARCPMCREFLIEEIRNRVAESFITKCQNEGCDTTMSKVSYVLGYPLVSNGYPRLFPKTFYECYSFRLISKNTRKIA